MKWVRGLAVWGQAETELWVVSMLWGQQKLKSTPMPLGGLSGQREVERPGQPELSGGRRRGTLDGRSRDEDQGKPLSTAQKPNPCQRQLASPEERAGCKLRDPCEARFSHTNLTDFTSTPGGKDSHFTGEESAAQRLRGMSRATQQGAGQGLIAL